MPEKNEYEKFANECHDAGKDLNEAMVDEIASIIGEHTKGHYIKARQIMKLIWATRYEW